MNEKLPPVSQDPQLIAPAVANVAPIGKSEGQLIRGIEDLEAIVEGPALPACQNLFDKNIRTISSSANGENGIYIDLDFGTLSDENKAIALELGEPVDMQDDGAFDRLKITLSGDKVSSEEDAAAKLVELSDKFETQRLTWAPTYTYAELKQLYGIPANETVKFSDFTEYFDRATQKFHVSEEMYKKSLFDPEQEKITREAHLTGDHVMRAAHLSKMLEGDQSVVGFADKVTDSLAAIRKQAEAGSYSPAQSEALIAGIAMGATTKAPLLYRELTDNNLKILDGAGLPPEDRNFAGQFVTDIHGSGAHPEVIGSKINQLDSYLTMREKQGVNTVILKTALYGAAYAAAAGQPSYLQGSMHARLQTLVTK